MKFFNLSPLTQKRLERFRKSRVAFFSLRLLIVLYLISLCAEVICNGKPLLMRFNGEWSCPFLMKQPPSLVQEITGNTTHIDYRQFTKSEAFLASGENFVLFAPVRYSPGETLDTADLEDEKVVTLSLIPNQPVGRFNLTRDFAIVRQDNCAQFFPNVSLHDRHTKLEELIEITPELRQEINRRLRGEACDAYETDVRPMSSRAFSWSQLHLSLAPSEGGEMPLTVRVNLCALLPNAQKFLPKLTYACSLCCSRLSDAAGNLTEEITCKPANKQTPQPSAELFMSLQKWARWGFNKDITSADNVSYVDSQSGTVYAVYSGNNIRFPFPPTRRHIFGLDGSGRDVFSRIVYATRIAMSFGLLLAVAATVLGMAIGAVQGYFGGKVDICIQRFTEIWAAMPFLYIMVLVGAVFGRSFWLLLLVYGLFCWLGLSYYMRAEFLRLRNRPFVAAARCQGLTNARIIFRHILPNALTPIITLFPFLLVGAIGSLVSLDFLGFGLPPLTPSWGELLNQAQTYRWAWWLILFPSLAIFVVMFLTVMVGEGVRNAFDPKPFSKLQ